MKYSGSEILIKLLERQGIEIIAGVPGGANLPIYNALYKSNIKHVLCRHEQGAGFFAQGITRSTGEVAVCFATSGPGATNVITAIADAKLDSIPIIIISGQVSSSLIGTDAFQEVDTYGITVPITKHNFLVRSVEELLEIIPEAFNIAQSGRPGPVLIDIPKDVQNALLEFESWPEIGSRKITVDYEVKEIVDGAELINASKRPVLYIGGGIIHSEAYEELYDLAKKNSIPVTSTLMGLGCFPSEDPLFIGMLGMHGARYTNFILEEADLLITVGARFDDRATGNIKKFCQNAKVLHVDIDHAEINKNRRVHHYIVGDTKDILRGLLERVEQNSRMNWIEQISSLKEKHPFIMPPEEDKLHPLNIISKANSWLNDDAIIATDVGQHQMWVAQVYKFQKPRRLLTSGGLGTMGFGMPAAIGAAIVNPDKKVVCFSGDGSILMNIQELATLADLQLDVKVIIMNNGHLGMVRQQQEMFYEENYIASKFDTSTNFAMVAEGFGIKGIRITKNEEIDTVFKAAILSEGPVLIDIDIRSTENVLPIVPPGAANYEMLGGEYNEG